MKTLNKILYCILFIILIFFGYLLTTLNVVPSRYYWIVMGIIIALAAIIGFCIFKIKAKVVQCLLCIICILLAIGFGYIDYHLYRTDHFISSVDKELKETTSYYVLIEKDSSYTVLEELEKKNIGTYSFNSENYEEAIALLKSKVSFNEQVYTDVTNFTEDLAKNKVDAIFINANNYEILKEAFSDFEEKVKILYELKVELKKEAGNVIQQNSLLEKPFHIYISGIDTTGSIESVSRSDVNIVMTINPKTSEIVLTSIPRDYYVQLHGTTGLKDKLTHAGIYGVDMSMKTIEDLLDISIDHYIRVNFSTLVKVIDALGGIDVYSDESFSEFGYTYQKGMNHLNGEQALMFTRIRHVFVEGDRKRGEHQQAVIEAVINKLSSSKTLLLNYASLLNSLKGTFQTSIDSDLIKEFVKYQLEEMPSWQVKSVNLDGTGASEQTYSMPGRLLYVMIPDEKTIAEAQKYINGVAEGKTITEIENPESLNTPDETTETE